MKTTGSDRKSGVRAPGWDHESLCSARPGTALTGKEVGTTMGLRPQSPVRGAGQGGALARVNLCGVWVGRQLALLGRMRAARHKSVRAAPRQPSHATPSRSLNPKVPWCYEFEDFVGTIIRAARGCMSGTPLHLVGHKVLANYLLVLQMRLNR